MSKKQDITADLARINRIPSDWGLEIGTLVEVYRNCSQKRVCQRRISSNAQLHGRVGGRARSERSSERRDLNDCRQLVLPGGLLPDVTGENGGNERTRMILLGVVLVLLGLVTGAGILYSLGAILLVVGAVLYILGATNRAVGPRRHYW